ncbi:uncharacterized protein LOC101863204 [Aplysia californica]|uniref:Uncharacterized protein LOC101863204 n=1 Tax=Aplysia californica TaxID=6500 RepID=A0ABM1VXR6_APLCA|nr:uncharacterized protein LOC101863204 [Aplysia californica]
MGCQSSFKSAGMMTIITFFVVLLANFCNWLSFTTTSWLVTDLPSDTNGDVNLGLWRRCRSKLIGCDKLDGYADPTFGAVQAFAIFGFISVNLGFFLIVLFVFWGSCKRNTEVSAASAGVLITAAITWLIAILVFALDVEESGADNGFSFGFAICAAILSLIGGVMMIFAPRSD